MIKKNVMVQVLGDVLGYVCCSVFCLLMVSGAVVHGLEVPRVLPVLEFGDQAFNFGGDPIYNSGDRLRVLNLRGTHLLAQRNFKAVALSRIPYGETVEVIYIEDGTCPIREGWLRGNWVCARYRGEVGYIFDGHLSRLPVPAVGGGDGSALSRPLKEYLGNCFRPVGVPGTGDGADAAEECGGLYAPLGADLTVETAVDENQVTPLVCRYRCHGDWDEIRLKGIRLMDAYNLAAALLKKHPHRSKILKDLYLVKDKEGNIYQIRGRKRKSLYIRRTRTNEIILKMYREA